jgi:hypothetical protein
LSSFTVWDGSRISENTQNATQMSIFLWMVLNLEMISVNKINKMICLKILESPEF